MTGDRPTPEQEILDQFRLALAGMDAGQLRQLVDQRLDDPNSGALGGALGGALDGAGRGGGLGARGGSLRRRPAQRRARRADRATFRVRVDLEHAAPPIWRRLDLRSDLTLDVVHQVLQAAFGWTDSHLHRFALGGSPFDRHAELFLCPFDAAEGEDEGVPASEVRLDEALGEPGDELRYVYDYGDSWDLVIRLEEVGPVAAVQPTHDGIPTDAAPVAVCIGGRRAAPPEDCGGLRDAEDLAEVLDDPAHFDPDEVNRALDDPFHALLGTGLDRRLLLTLGMLRDTEVGAELLARARRAVDQNPRPSAAGQREVALHPVLWFLDRVGEAGLPLTAAGYLKPEVVLEAAAVVPLGADWIGAKSREVDAYPVLVFREGLQQLGLLRKSRGRLLLTRAGAAARTDPERLWRHLATRLPVGREGEVEQVAGLLALVLAASAPDQPVEHGLIADALTELGWAEGPAGAPVSEMGARRAAADTLDVLGSVGLGPRNLDQPRRISAVAGELAAAALVTRA